MRWLFARQIEGGYLMTSISTTAAITLQESSGVLRLFECFTVLAPKTLHSTEDLSS
jgi:hypothetical protein